MRWLRVAGVALLGVFFIAAGANHFAHGALYARIVPPWLPDAPLLVRISGVAEILGGIGTLIPATRRVAGVGLVLLLVAVFPANVQMALHPELYRDLGSETEFLIRLPLQIVLLAWVWWAARPLVGRDVAWGEGGHGTRKRL